MGAETKYNWTDNPTESGVAVCDTDVLNDCLMHLKYENIGLNKITNCLLEVPQRIKYTLADGVLTIKAGSQVIVPYGVEDLTAQYPVGSTFLNDNLKVADTQFADGKFFVWAELQSDTTRSISGNTTCFLQLGMNDGTFSWYTVASATSGGSTAPTGSSLWFDTTNNYAKGYNGGNLNQYTSLPIGIFTLTDGYITSFKHFNGMGYIGSTVWVDKGVKGLIPNGRNEDGSLKNVEHTENKLTVYTNASASATYVISLLPTYSGIGLQQVKNYYYLQTPMLPDVSTASSKAYVFSENTWYECNSGTNYTWQKLEQVVAGEVTWVNGTITNLDVKQPFHAPDIQDVVRKTGDTMSGHLEFEGTAGIGLFGGSIYTHTMDMALDDKPSGNKYYAVIQHEDKNMVRKSRLESYWATDGSHGVQLSERKNASTGSYANLLVGFDANGNAYTYAPHSSYTNSIVTQAGLSKAANGYCKFGNGLIIQWGIFTPVSKNSGTVTLPTAFTGTNYSLCLTESGTAPTDDYANAITVKSWTKTNFTYQTGHAETPKYRYIAVGY